MTVAKFLNENVNDEFYTVQELFDDLSKLIERGLGGRIVMIDNVDRDYEVDYRFIKKEDGGIDKLDGERKCVYLHLHSLDVDDYLAEKIF